MFGNPSKLKSDNGPPFNGQKFAEFCAYFGVEHQKITPELPQANGGAERFMASLAKIIRIAQEEKRDWREAVIAFLRTYRATPHATTGVAPNDLMFGRNKTSRLPQVTKDEESHSELIEIAAKRDEAAKAQSKVYTDKRRRANAEELQVGDHVYAKEKRSGKWRSAYSNEDMVVLATKGTMVTVKGDGGRTLTRNRAFFTKQAEGVVAANVHEHDARV
jgi:hypothetical protein